MKMKPLFMPLAAAVLFTASCSLDELADDNNNGSECFAKAINSSFSTFDDEGATRSVVDPSGLPIAFKWADGDQLAIYSETGAGLTNFDLIDGIDSDVAIFKANGFSLTAGAKYYAFTPYDGNETNKTQIAVDYTGQVQAQNGSYSHLGAKDFQYSSATTAVTEDANNMTSFNLSHLGAVCRFQLTVPEAGVFTEFTLSGTALASEGILDITSGAFTRPVATDGSITLSLVTSSSSGISVNANEVLTLYMMLPKQDLSGKDLTATLTTNDSKAYSATLTGKNIEGGHAYTWTADVKVPAPPHDYVDLGLSVLWATCNVGAENPEDYGLYFAWGETVGYGPGTSDGKNGTTTDGRKFDWASYKWMDHSINAWQGCLKYTFADNKTSGKWYSGSTYVGTTVDGKTYMTLTKLEAADDAATANRGGNWRMPTKAEQDELRNTSNCTWEKVMDGSTLKGYKVISKKAGYEGNYIFLPAAGCRYDSSLSYVGSGGYYWSSELSTRSSNGACNLDVNSSNVDWSYYSRYYGQSVRPVCPKN